MPRIAAYHRPTDLDQALALLAEPNRVPLAGGTTLNANRAHSDLEAVDLQSLGLSSINAEGDRLHIGATTTIAELADAAPVPSSLREIARRELPSTLRTVATVGGTIAAASADSVLLAALLVRGASVELARGGTTDLAALLSRRVPSGDLILSVAIDPAGETVVASTGRTPADTPIVAAVARGSLVAVTGVADTPVLVDPQRPLADLSPPSDFRGSADYRLELARVLVARVTDQTGAVR